MNLTKTRRVGFLNGVCGLIIMLVLLTGVTGCGKKKLMSLHIIPEATANDGRPLYLMVREVNKKTFLTEYYDEVANLLHAENRNEVLLGWSLILPGQRKEVKIPKPEESDIAVYGMFTDPGSSWKVRIPVPFRKNYVIKVEGNNLVQAVKKKRRKKQDGEAL